MTAMLCIFSCAQSGLSLMGCSRPPTHHWSQTQKSINHQSHDMQNQSNAYTPAQPAAAALVQCRPLQAYPLQVLDWLSLSSAPLSSPRYFLLEDLSLMVTRHMAKMTHEEYLPRCRVPVITSLEEEQRIISTSAKVGSEEERGGEG